MKKETFSFLSWLVCLTAALFFFYEFVQLNLFNTLSQNLLKDFNLSHEQLGLFSSCYFYAQIIFILPAGFIIDRFTVKRTIIIALSVCVFATYMLSITNNIFVAFLMRFLVGFASTFCFLSCLKLIDRWIPSKWTAFATGTTITIAMLGGVVAQTPAEILFNYVGWRDGIKLDALIGIIILFLIIFIVNDYPAGYKNTGSHRKELSVKNSLTYILTTRENWLYGAYTCFMNLPIFVFAALWGNNYLVHVNLLEEKQASLVVSMILIGTIVGAPILGFISDKLNKHITVMFVSAISCLLLSGIIFLHINASLKQLMVYFFTLGFISSAQSISYPMMMKITPKFLSCSSISFAGLIIMLGGGILQPLWGLVIEKGGYFVKGGNLSNQHLAFSILIIGFLFAVLAAGYLNSKK